MIIVNLTLICILVYQWREIRDTEREKMMERVYENAFHKPNDKRARLALKCYFFGKSIYEGKVTSTK